ncbi:MAG: acyl-CoA dehydrogenase family protein [Nocardioides sp.]|uniref:acyl-CoA dehydrogenase family protein n=1 Tax=Nocardioides sp. TaxID=35761 RepID=UPI0039E48FDD
MTATATRVPFATEAGQILAVVPRGAARTVLALVNASDATLAPGTNLAGECRADVVLTATAPLTMAVVDSRWQDVDRALRLRGALLRSAQIAGAIERALELSARHATQRVQFGQPIARFQSVQDMLAALVGEKVAVAAATRLAARAVERLASATATSTVAVAAVAAAKIRAGEAADLTARLAHQVHGAIGVTREHDLHRTTQALWSWRDEYGDVTYWATELAGAAAQNADGLWAWLTTMDATTAGV